MTGFEPATADPQSGALPGAKATKQSHQLFCRAEAAQRRRRTFIFPILFILLRRWRRLLHRLRRRRLRLDQIEQAARRQRRRGGRRLPREPDGNLSQAALNQNDPSREDKSLHPSCLWKAWRLAINTSRMLETSIFAGVFWRFFAFRGRGQFLAVTLLSGRGWTSSRFSRQPGEATICRGHSEGLASVERKGRIV